MENFVPLEKEKFIPLILILFKRNKFFSSRFILTCNCCFYDSIGFIIDYNAAFFFGEK